MLVKGSVNSSGFFWMLVCVPKKGKQSYVTIIIILDLTKIFLLFVVCLLYFF